MNPNPYYSRYYTFIKPLVRNKYVKNYSTLVFSLVLTVIFAVFAIKPTLIAIISVQKSIAEKRIILKKLNDKADNLSKAQRNYQNIDGNVKTTIESLVPDNVNISTIISALNYLSDLNQASISGIQVQPIDLTNPTPNAKKQGNLDNVLITFNILGDYRKATNFLNQLTTMPRLIEISGISMNQRDSGELVVTLNGKAYVLR